MSKGLTVQEALKMSVGTRFNTNKGTGIVVIKASSEFEDELEKDAMINIYYLKMGKYINGLSLY